MKIRNRRSQLFGAFALIAIFALWLAPKANATTHTINKVTGTTITLPVYAANDTLEITGAALESADWDELRNNTNFDFHLFLNNPAMTTIDTNPAAVSIMIGNAHIRSLKAPHILSIADGGWFAGVYYGAFKDCSNLESVSLSAASIGGWAFYGCAALKSVSLPAVISIETEAFKGCSNLENVSMPAATTISTRELCRVIRAHQFLLF